MMSALPQTSTVTTGQKLTPTTYPVWRFVAERQFKMYLVGFAFLALVIGIVGVLIAIGLLQKPQKVFVLDAAGNYIVGPLEDLRKSSPLITTVAAQATLQFFSRGPGGLDNPELAQRLFAPEAFARLLEDVKSEQRDMEAKDLRFKPEIRGFDLSIPDDSGRFLLRVSGFYTISGSVDGMALTDKRDFTLTLAIIPNPDYAARGMYPFIVSAYKKVLVDQQ